MRNSEKYKYSKKKEAKGSSSKPAGKAKPWLEFKMSPETDLKATNILINRKTSKGIIGKISPQFKALSQY